jgi:hypothetical protein
MNPITCRTIDQLCVETDASDIIIFLLMSALIKFVLTIFGTNLIVPGEALDPRPY